MIYRKQPTKYKYSMDIKLHGLRKPYQCTKKVKKLKENLNYIWTLALNKTRKL